MVDSSDGSVTIQNGSKSSLLEDVKAKKDMDPSLVELKKSVETKVIEYFSKGGDGVLRYQVRLCVPSVDGLREFILEEAHSSQYLITPGSTKMYRDLRDIY